MNPYKKELASATAIAGCIKDDELHEDYIVPSIFDRDAMHSVLSAVANTARKMGLACQW